VSKPAQFAVAVTYALIIVAVVAEIWFSPPDAFKGIAVVFTVGSGLAIAALICFVDYLIVEAIRNQRAHRAHRDRFVKPS
jgi:hypothetical protein